MPARSLTRFLFRPANSTAAALCGLLLGLCLSGGTATAAKFNRKVDTGDAAPAWTDLAGVDGKSHSLKDYAESKLLVVVFTCNHCPVAKAYEARLKALAAKYPARQLRVVAISPSIFPADSLDKMKERAAAEKFNFDYLCDATQQVGLAWGARATPQVFLLNQQRKIVYMGAIDDSMYPDRVKENYLADAITAALAGKEPEIAETRPFGCPIEYDDE